MVGQAFVSTRFHLKHQATGEYSKIAHIVRLPQHPAPLMWLVQFKLCSYPSPEFIVGCCDPTRIPENLTEQKITNSEQRRKLSG